MPTGNPQSRIQGHSGKSKFLSVLLFIAISVQAAEPSPTSAPLTSVSPAAAAPLSRISSFDTKQLLKQFQNAQSTELEVLRKRQKTETQELKASQAAREKEWNAKEVTARREFFKNNRKGKARRAYMKGYYSRRSAFLHMLSEERTSRQHDLEVRLKAIQQDQSQKLKEFKAHSAKGETPPQSLWPQIGS